MVATHGDEIDWAALAPGKDCETPEEWASYDRWFRAKVEASLADSRPSIPHEEVMAHIQRKLDAKRPDR